MCENSVFLTAKKTTMPYESMLELIAKRSANHMTTSMPKLESQIALIESLTCKYLSIKNGRTMKIAKLNTKIDMNVVRSEIQQMSQN